LACFGLTPYRCRACRHRFFRFHSENGDGAQSEVEIKATIPVQAITAESISTEPEQTLSPWPLAEHPLTSVPIAHSLLIVSRDPAIRKLLCKLLARPGYYTHQLADAAQLPAELRARKVDVVIADLELPEQQGLESAAALRDLYPNLKIIALSGLSVVGVPGSTVLPKPFRRELFLESVQNALIGAAETRLPVT
jgi:CheY-like chemotaxis protein